MAPCRELARDSEPLHHVRAERRPARAAGAYVMQRLRSPGELAARRHAALFLVASAVSFFAMALFGTLTAVGLLPSDASLPWRLVPAVAATAIIALAIVYARLPSPVERVGGRISGSIWSVRRFVHEGVRTTYTLLRHGDRFLAVGAHPALDHSDPRLGNEAQHLGRLGPMFWARAWQARCTLTPPSSGSRPGARPSFLAMSTTYSAMSKVACDRRFTCRVVGQDERPFELQHQARRTASAR